MIGSKISLIIGILYDDSCASSLILRPKKMESKKEPYWKHHVPASQERLRISDYCGGAFAALGSKSAAKKAIIKGRVLLNGKVAKTADFIQAGDLIELQGTGVRQIKRYEVNLEIVYEDDFLIVINKPGGIAVNGNRYKTVENGLVGLAKVSNQEDALPRPVAVHRIDVPTKGLVLLAKTKKTQIILSKAFQDKQIKKEYVAIVHGKLIREGLIEEPIKGKKAITRFQTIETTPSQVYQHLSLVKLEPITGRTHQLRIHLRNQGHLIVGDKMYAKEQKTILGKGLFLCACKMQFKHPATQKMLKVEIDPPTRFSRLMQREKERY